MRPEGLLKLKEIRWSHRVSKQQPSMLTTKGFSYILNLKIELDYEVTLVIKEQYNVSLETAEKRGIFIFLLVNNST